jgi:tripartite-type tricarboxylate transporter receptor subunit TctC
LTGFDVSSWSGVLAPAKTPAPVIRRLYTEIVRIVNTADMKHYMLSQGAEPGLMDPDQFGAYLKTEIAKWANVVKAAKMKVD